MMTDMVRDAIAAETERQAKRKRKAGVPLERAIQKACLQWLAMKGIPAWRQNTGQMKIKEEAMPSFGGSVARKPRFVRFGMTGQADITGVLPEHGLRLEIEVKRPGEKVSDAQAAFGIMIVKAGGIYIVVRSVKELEEKMERILNYQPVVLGFDREGNEVRG